MAHFSTSLSLAVAAILCTSQIAMAETRAERNLRPAGDTRIADLPAGHWATNATQVILANNILTLDNGAFKGDRKLSGDELNQVMDALANTAESLASKGTNAIVRAAIHKVGSSEATISRVRLADTLAPFLDACATQELVAIAAANNDASRYKDIGATVPAGVRTVVDKYKVMTGYPDNTFRPDETVSRYQMAAIAHNILNNMRMAPMARLPVNTTTNTTQTIIVESPAEIPVVLGRPNYRERAAVHLAWQAVNHGNLQNNMPFGTIPLEAMITGYNGPLMLQNVTDVKIAPFQSNMVDSQFRVGYAGLKSGMWQAIPFVAAHLGVGTSAVPGDIQYDSYAGPAIGGILSVRPMDTLELSAHASHTQLMTAGRFSGAFAPITYPSALGTGLTNYGVAGDIYIARNICLTLGLSTWQNPASLRVGPQTNALGVLETWGLHVGMGSSF